ncbi:uncharacterized protein C5orf34 homolog isoform X1 [Takifugu flavidus]|uniref:uncharacterized protein C5orf34 homolog isoform X1 n=1 Tax=Takifugu flavidus TaxID=433684 RepID=UPI002544C21A|nr:uncharacterized protein C5orf34 homolog isoform X1 [Takifugu flavidus]
MMECNGNTSLMIMYEDESVEVRYKNDVHLQLSPCGSEFILVKPSGDSPLTGDRVRQRTRFTISTYKELIVGALTFRNTYASQPYLPDELIPVDHKKPFFSLDLDMKWPELCSCIGELGSCGELIIRSEEGRAVFILGPSGQEFSVQYTCCLSGSHNQNHSTQDGSTEPEKKPVNALMCGRATAAAHGTNDGHLERNRNIKLLSLATSNVQPKPEAAYQSTTVVQHFSCRAVAPHWRYPLSLAQHLLMTLSQPDDVRTEEQSFLTQLTVEERRSHLPQALPLTCPSPQWHRGKFADPLLKNEHRELQGELVKVMWCHGITYRVLSGVVPVIEVSLGDGSVMRSNSILNTYFTHHKPDCHSGKRKVKEVIYHVNNLPPDLPGQPYSVRSVVNRATRILSSYTKAKQMLQFPATPSCLQLWKTARNEECGPFPVSAEQHANVTHTGENMSGIVAAELEKIKHFNFLLDHPYLPGRGIPKEKCSGEEAPAQTVDENDVTAVLQRTSKAIQDIDALVATAMHTSDSHDLDLSN